MSDHIEHSCRHCGSLIHYEDKCPQRPQKKIDERSPTCSDDCPPDCPGHNLWMLDQLDYDGLKDALKEENKDIYLRIEFLEEQDRKYQEYKYENTDIWAKVWAIILEEFPGANPFDRKSLPLYIDILKTKLELLEKQLKLNDSRK